MSHTVVKILSDMYGEKRDKSNLVWHLSVEDAGDKNTLCEGEFYGFGAGTNDYKEKEVNKGGITCSKCLQRIKEIKKIQI